MSPHSCNMYTHLHDMSTFSVRVAPCVNALHLAFFQICVYQHFSFEGGWTIMW